jgi:hypothetical protein
MTHFILSLIFKAIEILFGTDLEGYINKYSKESWFVYVDLVLLIAALYVFYKIFRMALNMYRGKGITEEAIKYDRRNTIISNIKSPFSRPDYKGERASGSCPICGYPIVVAKRSYITGKLYFSCASNDKSNICKFKGCPRD